jgi:hypothetical protein
MATHKNDTSLVGVAETLADNVTFGQVSVGTSAVQLLAANAGRRAALITNTSSTATLYVGSTSGVTTATGHPIPPLQSFKIGFTGTIYGIASAGTIAAGASDLYDFN